MSETPGKMYALAVVLSLLAIAATVLRFYARYIKKAGYSWDDMVLLPALVRCDGSPIICYRTGIDHH